MERFSIPDCVCKAKMILGTPAPEPRGGAHSREQFETVPGIRYDVLGWPKAGTQRCACHCVTWDSCQRPPPRGRSEQRLGPQRRSGQAPLASPQPFCRRRGPPVILGSPASTHPPCGWTRGREWAPPPIGAAVGCTPRLLCSRLPSSMLTQDPRTQWPLRSLCGFLAGGTRLQKDGSPGATSTKS